MTNLQGREKSNYVRDMFGRIAHRYDLMNRLMTFGQDRSWRRYVLQVAQLPAGGKLLDVATGTGDIALQALEDDPSIKSVGMDFSAPMMIVGRERKAGTLVMWCESDAMHLPLPDESFDAVTSGYLMRNVLDVSRAFSEQLRVVRPGGRVVCLDTTPPGNILRPFILLYFKFVIPLMGRIITGDASAYKYLPESTKAFKNADELAQIMRDVGFGDVSYRRFMFGTMAVHVGTRPERV